MPFPPAAAGREAGAGSALQGCDVREYGRGGRVPCARHNPLGQNQTGQSGSLCHFPQAGTNDSSRARGRRPACGCAQGSRRVEIAAERGLHRYPMRLRRPARTYTLLVAQYRLARGGLSMPRRKVPLDVPSAISSGIAARDILSLALTSSVPPKTPRELCAAKTRPGQTQTRRLPTRDALQHLVTEWFRMRAGNQHRARSSKAARRHWFGTARRKGRRQSSLTTLLEFIKGRELARGIAVLDAKRSEVCQR